MRCNGVKSKTTSTESGGRWDKARSRVKTTHIVLYVEFGAREHVKYFESYKSSYQTVK